MHLFLHLHGGTWRILYTRHTIFERYLAIPSCCRLSTAKTAIPFLSLLVVACCRFHPSHFAILVSYARWEHLAIAKGGLAHGAHRTRTGQTFRSLVQSSSCSSMRYNWLVLPCLLLLLVISSQSLDSGELEALQALRASWQGLAAVWPPNTPPCSLYGITCSNPVDTVDEQHILSLCVHSKPKQLE